jgi:hypothetical protein
MTQNVKTGASPWSAKTIPYVLQLPTSPSVGARAPAPALQSHPAGPNISSGSGHQCPLPHQVSHACTASPYASTVMTLSVLLPWDQCPGPGAGTTREAQSVSAVSESQGCMCSHKTKQKIGPGSLRAITRDRVVEGGERTREVRFDPCTHGTITPSLINMCNEYMLYR